MKIRLQIYTLSLVLTALMPASTLADSLPIQEAMTEQDLKKSGLNKLSKKELTYLNKWLNKTAPTKKSVETKLEKAPTTAAPVALTNITREQAKAVLNQPLDRTIAGNFRGWSGKTVFIMENGERWKQRIGGKYFKKLESPKVTISKTKLGFYEMEILATGKKVGVKKVD